ncbi:alpha-1,2-fucosyltransferase [Caldifermentibacillus hisashii]|uniref:alpha-1,2-fucosyltransferase n=1 Tax=Caldifermentibacillus hisashii TaxID=996558 RepID=UPI003D260C89
MIVVKVIGGLGNQMFQIAFAKALSLELNEDIYIDVSVYKKYKIRNFSLSNLKISNSIKYIENLNIPMVKRLYFKLTQIAYHVYQKVAKDIISIDTYGKRPFKFLSKRGLFYNFDRYYYEVNTCCNTEVKCLYGYFQSEKYFKKYKNEIVEELKVKSEPSTKEKEFIYEISSCNSVGVSMRLGDDYVNSKSLNVCKEDYYYKAMDYIYSKNENVIFYIFSDSIDKVKERFNFKYPVRYVEGFKDFESLRLLYTCKHFIISNSSFSWWGAYLSENKDKYIIAPSRWYNDSNKRPDIYTDEMTLLDV